MFICHVLNTLSILTAHRKNNLKKAVNNKKQNGVNERWFSG
ncbi:hypothetical protein CHCC14814_1650 [Bacillus paralicheniformis]|nr:hypothetical protein CHCC14814_1650 [Bacillus paralicheniformis]